MYIYGYLSRIQSSRRLEREAQRNVELIWLTTVLADRGYLNGEEILQCAQAV
jgi:transposase